MEGCGLDSCVSGQGHNDGCCDYCYKISASTESGNLLTEGVVTISFSRMD
jgi:hypothetical protein